MNDGATFRRTIAAAALVATPLLSAISVVLQPDLGSDSAGRLAALSGALPAVSAVAFLLAQLPAMVAFLALGHVLRDSARRLSLWGVCLGVLGAFGHTVFGGMSMLELVMAGDALHRPAYAGLLDSVQASPVMLFSAIGLVGTVAGTLLISVALWRSRFGPRWVSPALWAFLLVEFLLASAMPYARYLSPVLMLAAYVALAVEVWRQPISSWSSRPAASAPSVATV
jgi:hypothetical protein